MIVKFLALVVVLALQTPTLASQAAPSSHKLDAQKAFSMLIGMVADPHTHQNSRLAALESVFPQLSWDDLRVMLQLAQIHRCQEKSHQAEIVYDDVCKFMGADSSEQLPCPSATFSDAVLPYQHPKYRKALGQDEE